jgi:iron complex outermembrane receptor protein
LVNIFVSRINYCSKWYLLIVLFCCNFLLFNTVIFAQKDTIHQLKTFSFSTNQRLSQFADGVKSETLDSSIAASMPGSTLAEMLAMHSPIYIKSYGGGSLATTSFRGGCANHTQVLWNGFNIASPANGQIDFSLLPSSLFNKVSLQYGASSTLWGSGAIGGAIHLQSIEKYDQGLSASGYAGIGSFNENVQQANLLISKQKIISSTKFFNSYSLNNFNYQNTTLPNSPIQQLQHAKVQQMGFMQENYFKIKSNQQIEFHLWYQQAQREIPPILLQVDNLSEQADNALRATGAYNIYFSKVKATYRAGYFIESLLYEDKRYLFSALSKTKTLINEVEIQYTLNPQHKINGGLNSTYSLATGDGFSANKPTQLRNSIFASYRYSNKNNKFNSTLSGRQEWINNKIIPFVFSIGANYQIYQSVAVRGSVARVYRLPTLNDLFWAEGGNQQLLPEQGYAFEGGLVLKLPLKSDKIAVTFEPTFFTRTINNWIIWLPGQFYWTPTNLLKVWSRGAETKTTFTYANKKAKWHLSIFTNYVVSTNENKKSENDASVGQQLIYVPMYTAQAEVGCQYKNLFVNVNQGYTGYRYTTTDHSNYLNPYYLTNVSANFVIPCKKISFTIIAQAQNIFNATYMALAVRPMPGRNYRIGVNINFKGK